jgi:hypothetical protein
MAARLRRRRMVLLAVAPAEPAGRPRRQRRRQPCAAAVGAAARRHSGASHDGSVAARDVGAFGRAGCGWPALLLRQLRLSAAEHSQSPLYRLYEKGLRSISNSYAVRRTLGAAREQQQGLTSMSTVVCFDRVRGAAIRAPKLQRFFRKLGAAFDVLVRRRFRHTIQGNAQRRTDRDIERCRRLLHAENPPAAASRNQAARRRRVRTMPAQ